MKSRKLALAGILCALAILGSFLSIPVLGSKVAPVQHIVNVLGAVMLGPWYALGIAFASSLLRNLLGIGTLMAFPGSMFGAFLAGLGYKYGKKLTFALVGEVFGTSVLGGLCAYPIAILFLGKTAGELAFYAYILPFFFSTFTGALIAGAFIYALKGRGILNKFN